MVSKGGILMKSFMFGFLVLLPVMGFATADEFPSIAKAICADRNGVIRDFSDITVDASGGAANLYIMMGARLERMIDDQCSQKSFSYPYLTTDKRDVIQKMAEDTCNYHCSKPLGDLKQMEILSEEKNCKRYCKEFRARLDVYTRAFFAGEKSARETCATSSEQSGAISNLSRDASKIIEKAPAEKAKVEQSNTIKP